MKNSEIRSIKANYGAVISAKEFTEIEFINCTISQNYAGSNLFDIIDSKLFLEKITISNNINNLFSVVRSSIILTDILIINHSCMIVSQGCLLYVFDNSQIYIINSVFNKVESMEKDNIFLFESSLNISMVSFTFTNTKVKKGSCFSGVSSNISVNSTYFSFFDGNAIYLENSVISLSNSLVIDFLNKSKLSEKNKFGAFVCLDCFEIKIENCSFLNNKGVKGGAVYLIDSTRIESKEKYIKGGLFQENEGEEEGGALYMENQNIFIEGVKFDRNLAINGGAIFCYLDGNLFFK